MTSPIVKVAVMRLGIFFISGQGDLLIRFIPWNLLEGLEDLWTYISTCGQAVAHTQLDRGFFSRPKFPMSLCTDTEVLLGSFWGPFKIKQHVSPLSEMRCHDWFVFFQ